MDFAHDPRFAELLAEPLTDEEVRDLLERLGSKEFGGPENATVAAVVEATGSSVETVGNLLAQIRKEDFEERFGLKLEEHEDRIESLEALTHRRILAPVEIQDADRLAALNNLADQEILRQRSGPIVLVLALIAALVIAAVISSNRSDALRATPQTISTRVHDGALTVNERMDVWVKLDSGGTREPTAEEKEYSATLWYYLNKDKRQYPPTFNQK